MKVCIICEASVTLYEFVRIPLINCPICGPYKISEKVAMTLREYGPDRRYIYSGAVRELNERGRDVIINDFDALLDSVAIPDGPLEQIDRIVVYVYQKMDTADASVKFEPSRDYSVAYAKNSAEFSFLIERAKELEYLESPRSYPLEECRLTIGGWKHVAELNRNQVKTNQAFIAMSFDPGLRSVYLDGIKAALEQTGYVPLRVDDAQFNEKIDDRIIADIRKSGLVIAEFTQHKGGVYFEAGFALGLGIPVIWICRDTDLKDAHFDTRQYPHIVWQRADDLREQLIARIEATVPLKNRNS